jgi:hypothetical protein
MDYKLKNKFKRIVNRVAEDVTKKYLIEKISDHTFKYHSFIIEKRGTNDYVCKKGKKVIFEGICNLRLATMFCYSYLYKNTKGVRQELNKLNNAVQKNRQDVLFYRHYVKESPDQDLSHIYARITESNLVYEKLKEDIRILSTSI